MRSNSQGITQDLFILIYNYGLNFYYISFDLILISYKKLIKSILYSIILKIIINVIIVIFNFFSINPVTFIIFIYILLFWNFYVCKDKEEYIITFIFILLFWHIIFDYMHLNILINNFHSKYFYKKISLDISFFKSFVNNYGIYSFYDTSCNINYYLNNLFYKEKFEFKLFEPIFNFFKFWFNIELISTKEYDVLASVQKFIAKKELTFNDSPHSVEVIPYKLYNYNDYSSEICGENIYDNVDIKYEKIKYKESVRSDFYKQMLSEGGLKPKTFNLSLLEELNQVTYELETYKAQSLKFKDIISNIKKGKENFFPTESVKLFIDYIEVIDHLLEELNSRQLNIISNIPLPEETKEDIEYLFNESNNFYKESKEINDSFPENIPLPEQTEEEIDLLLEPEDFMSDALNNMGMFSEENN